MAKALNVGVTAWSPLANGILTGKYHGEGKAEVGRKSRQEMQEFLPEQERTEDRPGGLAAAPFISGELSLSQF